MHVRSHPARYTKIVCGCLPSRVVVLVFSLITLKKLSVSFIQTQLTFFSLIKKTKLSKLMERCQGQRMVFCSAFSWETQSLPSLEILLLMEISNRCRCKQNPWLSSCLHDSSHVGKLAHADSQQCSCSGLIILASRPAAQWSSWQTIVRLAAQGTKVLSNLFVEHIFRWSIWYGTGPGRQATKIKTENKKNTESVFFLYSVNNFENVFSFFSN